MYAETATIQAARTMTIGEGPIPGTSYFIWTELKEKAYQRPPSSSIVLLFVHMLGMALQPLSCVGGILTVRIRTGERPLILV